MSIIEKDLMKLDFHMNGYRLSDDFKIVHELSEKLIIETTSIQKWRFKFDIENIDNKKEKKEKKENSDKNSMKD